MGKDRRHESLSASPLRLGFLASHNGTDMQAIIQEIEVGRLDATAKVIISNNSNAPALQFARKNEIPQFYISARTTINPEEVISDVLRFHDVNLVIMSGWMKVLGDQLLEAFPGRILNVHGADPYKYKGMFGDQVHEAVIANGDDFTYPTIHVAEEKVDEGKILAQGKIKVLPNETVENLRTKVQEEEKRLYIQVLKDIFKGKIKLE